MPLKLSGREYHVGGGAAEPAHVPAMVVGGGSNGLVCKFGRSEKQVAGSSCGCWGSYFSDELFDLCFRKHNPGTISAVTRQKYHTCWMYNPPVISETVDDHRGITPRSRMYGLCSGVFLKIPLLLKPMASTLSMSQRRSHDVPDIDGRAWWLCNPSFRDMEDEEDRKSR